MVILMVMTLHQGGDNCLLNCFNYTFTSCSQDNGCNGLFINKAHSSSYMVMVSAVIVVYASFNTQNNRPTEPSCCMHITRAP